MDRGCGIHGKTITAYKMLVNTALLTTIRLALLEVCLPSFRLAETVIASRTVR